MEANKPTMELMEQEFWDSIMSEQDAVMREYDAKRDMVNGRIFKAIAKQIGEGFLKDLQELIEESGCKGYIYELTDTPIGDFQRESGFGCIVGMWVKQYMTGEDCGHGTICVKLKHNMWIKMNFSF